MPSEITFSFPGLDNVACAFTTRAGGVSREAYGSANLSFDVGDDPGAVRENRRMLRDRLGFESWVENYQVHGTDLRPDPEPTPLDAPGRAEADGLATAVPGRALVVKTADCQPVILAHESGRFVAGLHVGWRGNVLEFIPGAVEEICRHYDARPAELMAVRGPSLGPGASEFTNFQAEFGDGFRDYFDPATRTVDLWRLTRDQLAGAGLDRGRIFSIDLCTYDLDDFFSYRREKKSGRQMGVVWIKK